MENSSKTLDFKNKIRIKLVDTNTKETEIELDKSEQIKDIIKLYCEEKGLSNPEDYYLTKSDLNKLEENKTIKEAKICDNQTLYIFERNKIEFIINYQQKKFKIEGNSDTKFEECIKSFIEEKGENNFIFSLNGKNIEISKELNQLGIKNGDEIKAEQI